MLPQHWPNPDYCYLESVIGVKPRQLHQMADSTNPSLGGRVIQCHYLWGYSKNYWGFQGYSPFHFEKMTISSLGKFQSSFNLSKYLWQTPHLVSDGNLCLSYFQLFKTQNLSTCRPFFQLTGYLMQLQANSYGCDYFNIVTEFARIR